MEKKQFLATDPDGTLRFKGNCIPRSLLTVSWHKSCADEVFVKLVERDGKAVGK